CVPAQAGIHFLASVPLKRGSRLSPGRRLWLRRLSTLHHRAEHPGGELVLADTKYFGTLVGAISLCHTFSPMILRSVPTYPPLGTTRLRTNNGVTTRARDTC